MTDSEQIEAALDEVEDLYDNQLDFNKPHETEEDAQKEEMASYEWAKKEDQWNEKQQKKNPAKHLIDDEAEDNNLLKLNSDDEEASR